MKRRSYVPKSQLKIDSIDALRESRAALTVMIEASNKLKGASLIWTCDVFHRLQATVNAIDAETDRRNNS